MIKLILYLLILWAIFKIWRMLTPSLGGRGPRPTVARDPDRIDGGELVQDPQCGVYIPKATALKGPDGTRFCSEACLEAYQRKGK